MEKIEHYLKQYFGYDTFLPGQRDIIEHVLTGRDSFALMPTGAGKSLIYQLSALTLPGLTVVVSPLIALMQDQVDRLAVNGIAATFVNSSLNNDERMRRERAALNGELKLLYVAPERLLTRNFLSLLDEIENRIGLSLLAIDEAHCVSEWGHDFRPEYRQLGSLRKRYIQTPMLALTATATERVQQDILEQLQLQDPHVHIASFNRPNLFYEVHQKHQGSYKELVHLLREQPGESVIIYCQRRQSAEKLSELLQQDGISALPYHAGLSNEQRSEHQRRFINDDVPVLVATIAFGMGIAKPDVRMVVHYDLPRNLEGYYQESGRAGRDGQPARCVVFFNYGDRAKVEYMIAQRSSEQIQQIALQQVQQMMAYCEDTGCRRVSLLRYFGETFDAQDCGNCDNCMRPVIFEDRTIDAQKFLSCVARTQQRFGARYIAEVLRGANTQKIRDYGHDQLSTYGIGKDRSIDEWMHLGRALLQQGLVSESNDGYPILKLNRLSMEILKKLRSVEVPTAPVHQQEKASSRSSSAELTLDVDSLGLFQYLREIRKQLADEQFVAPYVVFPDSSLRAMAQQRPQTRDHFAKIPGVGSHKLDLYFGSFTRAISDYCDLHNLATGLEPLAEVKETRQATTTNAGPPTRQVTLDLYKEGRSIEEIAELRELKPVTILGHLADMIEAGEPVDIQPLVSTEKQQIIAAALQEIGGDALKPVKEFLGDDYSYGEIKLVRAIMLQN